MSEKALALFLETLLAMKEVKPLLINSHVSMDGGLLQAGTSQCPPKSVDRQKDLDPRYLPLPLPGPASAGKAA